MDVPIEGAEEEVQQRVYRARTSPNRTVGYIKMLGRRDTSLKLRKSRKRWKRTTISNSVKDLMICGENYNVKINQKKKATDNITFRSLPSFKKDKTGDDIPFPNLVTCRWDIHRFQHTYFLI